MQLDSSSDSNCLDDYEGSTRENKPGRGAKAEGQELAKGETWVVRRLKALVLVVLFVSAQAVSATLYMYVRHSEKAQFEASFQNDATKLLASFGANLEKTLSSADTFAVSVISHAKATGQQWPFVTVPDFAIRAGKVRDSTVAFIVNIYIYVQKNERPSWEAYTADPVNTYWVDESIDVQARNPHYNGPITREYKSFYVIHGYDEFDKENAGEFGTNRTGPYLVFWQCYPVVAFYPVFNWDLLTSSLSNGFEQAFSSKKTIIREPYLVWSDSNSVEQKEYDLAEADWVKDYVDSDEDPMEPIVDIYVPLLDESIEAYDVYNDKNTTAPDEKTFRGYFSLSIYWRAMMKNILPEGSNGIILVVENECAPTFTYQINGPRVKYLGGSDHHDDSYDNLEISASLLDLRRFAINGSVFTGTPIVDNYCPYNIRVFPSDLLKDKYTTRTSIVFVVCALMIFGLTIVAFLLYDFCVERRQKLVYSTAVRSEAIVSSLFPSIVRARIDQSANESTTDAFRRSDHALQISKEGSTKIADLFPNTTIFFADIV
jgi:hypothetical protein